MKVKNVVSSVLILLTSCVATKNKNYVFNQKYSATQVKNDIVLLKKILEANHPSLYWYTPKDSIDYFFTETLDGITDSLTEIQAKNKIAFVVSKIKCGHTSVRFSKQFTSLLPKHTYPQFPLSIKTWDDSMVVVSTHNPKDSALKRGTIITSINGKKNKEILATMFQYISADGNNVTYKSQTFSGNFSSWYKTIFGVDSAYVIGYLDSLSQEKFITIKSFDIKKDATKKRVDSSKTIVNADLQKIDSIKKNTTSISKTLIPKLSKQAKLLSYRSLKIDTSTSTAFITLNTFSNGHLQKFFRQSFDSIKQNNIKNLVIDLRNNGGGYVSSSTLLSRYLKDSDYKIGDTTAAISRSFHYRKYIQNWLGYWLLMQFYGTKMEDDLIHNRWYETHYYKPKTYNHFDGNIYILQGGYTFSAATMFASSLKGQKNVKLVGEETGGGYYGNTAMHIPIIILPDTKISVRLPIFRLVMDKARPKGRGVMPDIEIKPSVLAIKKGIDAKMLAVKQMIKDAQTK